MRLLFDTLLRLLFPTWAFFDVSGAPPSLEVRRIVAPDAAGAWEPVVRASPRRWWHLFYNPAGTYTLAAQTLVERLYTELRDAEGRPVGADAAAAESRMAETEALVANLAESVLLASWREDARASGSAKATWQWRIVVRDGADDAEWYLGAVQR